MKKQISTIAEFWVGVSLWVGKLHRFADTKSVSFLCFYSSATKNTRRKLLFFWAKNCMNTSRYGMSWCRVSKLLAARGGAGGSQPAVCWFSSRRTVVKQGMSSLSLARAQHTRSRSRCVCVCVCVGVCMHALSTAFATIKPPLLSIKPLLPDQ
jgi:hypothetical protein